MQSKDAESVNETIHEMFKVFLIMDSHEMSANNSDLKESIAKLEQDHQKSNYTFFIEDKKDPKTLTSTQGLRQATALSRIF